MESAGGQRRPPLRVRKSTVAGASGTPPPTDSLVAGTAGRCGERTERCRWQRERSERVAAVKISSVRRKAAWKFWAPQQDHRPLRRVWGWCMGVTDCHSQCAHWLRNDMVFCKRCGGAGRCRHRPLRKRILWCVGEGLCPSRGRPQGSPLRRGTRSAGKESPRHGVAVTAPRAQGSLFSKLK